MQERKLIAIDFDGVMTAHTGWRGYATIADEPNEGAIQWLRGLLLDNRFEVCVHSARCAKPEGIAAIMKWLKRNGVETALLERILFPEKKPNSHVLIDDRAIQFRGAFPRYDEIANFSPWRAKSAPERRSVDRDVNYQEAETEAEAAQIWQDEHRCLTCLHGSVCAVAKATKQLGVFPAVSRCAAYIESFMPELE